MRHTIEIQKYPGNALARERRDGLARGAFRRVMAAGLVGIGVAILPTTASAQVDDTSPSNAGLPGAELLSQIMAWGKWVGLVVCILAIVYGAATWRGMGGNTGRGVEGKMYVAAGAIGAMVIGLATIAVNTLYSAGNAGG
jgi:hypothetical protein